MKPTSIISLIVSILLIIAGLATCIIAQNMANANGEALFAESTGDGIVNTLSLADVDISKIDINVSDAEINIYGESKDSYIEFINFRENYYTLSTANRALTFREITDVVSMLKFWENGFSFKGMRHLLSFRDRTEGKKVINIYLTADCSIKVFRAQADNCTLTISNMETGSDYDFNFTTGTVTVNSLITSSSFKLNGTELRLDMKKSHVSNMEIKAQTLHMDASKLLIKGDAVINTVDGTVSIESAYDLSLLNLNLDTINGTVQLNGVDRGTRYMTEDVPGAIGNLTVVTDTADIALKFNVFGSSETTN